MKQSRRWKYGAMATTITVLGIVLIIVANIVVGQLTEKYGWSIDLTADDRYAISDESIQYLKRLKDEVDITVFVDEKSMSTGSYYLVQAYQNLLQYKEHSKKVKLEFVDLTENPTYISKYPDLDLSSWDILVESGKKQKVISFQDLYEYDSSGSQITASKVEQKVTGAIASVTSDATEKKVVVLNGFGENEPTDLTNLLQDNQYEITSRSLLTDDLDETATDAILFAPQKDLNEDCLRKLSSWLDNDGKQGRNLYVFLDPNAGSLPNLEAFLGEWGLKAEEGYAFESNSSMYYGKFYYPVAQYANMDYAEGMTSSDLTIMALCRPVDTLFENKDGYETSILLNFTSGSGTVKLGQTEITADQITGDVKGMVLSTHSWYGEEVTKSNILVSGSALAFTGDVMTSDTFANGRYILGVFKRLDDQSETVNIPAKNLSVENHTMSQMKTNIYTWGFMVVLPVIVLIVGIVVWVRRRHR